MHNLYVTVQLLLLILYSRVQSLFILYSPCARGSSSLLWVISLDTSDVIGQLKFVYQDFSTSVKNRLLASLPREEYERLQPYLEAVFLDFKRELYQPNVPIKFVYFPLEGVFSLLSLSSEGDLIEVATVGNEGMVGLPVFLGVRQIPGIGMC